MIAEFEKLWEKYNLPAQHLELNRTDAMTELNQFLKQLNYLN